MTMKVRTQSRWRFKRQPATHNFLIRFVRRADRLQYYDGAAFFSTGRGLRELSTALKIRWTLWAPSNRISGKFCTADTAVPAHDCAQGKLHATQMRDGDGPWTLILSPRGRSG